jgi:serine/threonine protein kinase
MDRLREAAEEPDLSATGYRLIRRIGAGGMSVVYLAEDTRLGRKVAVKVMNLPDDSGDMRDRMLREAHIVAQLEHPGIVPIHDVDMLPDGRVFYAMKYVQGRRLDQYAKSDRPLQDLLRVFLRVCEAVAFAHSFNVIHRDLKPENIMVGSFGEVLVMDWGIAKVLGEESTDATTAPESTAEAESSATLIQRLAVPGNKETAHGVVVGTPAYMAPEQARGDNQKVDTRTDVYALGAILYFICTGRAPYDPSPAGEATAAIPANGPIPPRRINRAIARPLEAVCVKAMSRDQNARYPSARDLEADVAAFLDGLAVAAYRENVFERAWRFLGRNRFLVLLIVAYLIMRFLLMIFMGR